MSRFLGGFATAVTAELILEIRDLKKAYGGLRPLRVKHLELRLPDSVALLGLDCTAAEAFVNLVTGATVPDEGQVRVFGQSTTAITDSDAWLASLDRFGILTDRAVLLDSLTVEQNLAVPFTLALDPVPDVVRVQVDALAREVGLESGDLARPVAEVPPASRARVRLARAIALDPRVLLAEHPSAALLPDEVPRFAADFSRVIHHRGLAGLTLTADRTFGTAVAERVLTLEPATGEVRGPSLLDRLRGRG